VRCRERVSDGDANGNLIPEKIDIQRGWWKKKFGYHNREVRRLADLQGLDGIPRRNGSGDLEPSTSTGLRKGNGQLI